jgi:hypothetical protein
MLVCAIRTPIGGPGTWSVHIQAQSSVAVTSANSVHYQLLRSICLHYSAEHVIYHAEVVPLMSHHPCVYWASDIACKVGKLPRTAPTSGQLKCVVKCEILIHESCTPEADSGPTAHDVVTTDKWTFTNVYSNIRWRMLSCGMWCSLALVRTENGELC